MVDGALEKAPPEIRERVRLRRAARERAEPRATAEAPAPEVTSPAEAVAAARKIVKPMPELFGAEQLEISAQQRKS